jgi:hypothetical protein
MTVSGLQHHAEHARQKPCSIHVAATTDGLRADVSIVMRCAWPEATLNAGLVNSLSKPGLIL